MYLIDLNRLAQASDDVRFTTFGALDHNKREWYIQWLLRQMSKANVDDSVRLSLWNAVLKATGTTAIMMGTGVLDYVDWVVKQLVKFVQSPKQFLIPVINDEWKSDAWLTGLVVAQLQKKGITINPGNKGMAMSAKGFEEVMPHLAKKASPQLSKVFGFDMTKIKYSTVTVDDASYTGTQMAQLLNNIHTFIPFGSRLNSVLCLAGASNVAGTKIGTQPFSSRVVPFCQLVMPSGPFGDAPVIKAIQEVTDYARHIEADPSSLKPRFIDSGHRAPFVGDVSYAILPYKIPDSISVPTHVYLAMGYDSKEAKGPASRLPKEPPTFIKHLFQTDGQVTYREVMRGQSNNFATPLTFG